MQETVGLVMVNERERGNVLSVESEADSSFPNRRTIIFVSCSLICSVVGWITHMTAGVPHVCLVMSCMSCMYTTHTRDFFTNFIKTYMYV
jgi:hypothetical protein